MIFFCVGQISFQLKLKKSVSNNFCEVLVQISRKNKKYVTHTSTNANVQNNYIKLPGFGFTKQDLYTEEMMISITC